MRTAEFETVRQVVKAPGSIEEKMWALAEARKGSKGVSDLIDEYLLAEVMRFERDLDCVRREHDKLRRVLEQVTQPPLFPAVFLTALPPGLMVMLPGGAKRVIPCIDVVDPESLRPGSDVLLNQDLNLVVATATETGQKGGEIGMFDRTLEATRLVLRHRDEEYVVEAVAPLNLEVDALEPGDLVRFDRGLMLAFERLPGSAGTHFFETDAPKATFADIGGLDKQIEEMKSLVTLRFFHPESAARYGLNADGAILLEGSPGTGKTMLAGALAHWVGELSGTGESKWISVRPGELRSEWYGVAERRVRECFQAARTAGALDSRLPVVLFFDEIDSIASTRGHSGGNVDDRVMQAFAAELDGVVGRGNVLVIGATNRRQALDPALLRPGRFGDKSITVPRPNMSAARAILEKQLPAQVPYYLNGHGSDVDAARADLIAATVSRLYAPNASASLGKLVFRDASVREVKASDLISGANLANITRAAREKACWREVAGEGCGLRLEDALAAIDQELDSLARVLTPRNVRDHITGLPDDLDVIRIERSPAPRSHAVHQYLTLS